MIILDGDINADWILGDLNSEKRKKEIQLINSVLEIQKAREE